ncbi:DUF2158 domain-containing protein [Novosphingobium sp. RL4]|uniref:DUF2158 domain-containing protein n=1 Tax=Novosphingobium sp. RL4 TaxID=3109595 RepID=UPI002D7A01CA|nr:DUF2158 domain-containing protein [Novosphingobium sp. RL4]WRT91909.1 DUF2158 domain-containing protein [Novosphingobium sp. RL4]
MSEAIQPGDVVQMKSGGNLMTVSKIDGNSANVYWMLEGEIKWGSVALVVLDKIAR